MALIERTIYPRFSKMINKNELIKLFTPYDEDIFEYVSSNFNEITKKSLDLMLETNEKGNALDDSEMKDFSENKRYAIILCLMYISTTKACDNLITMFIKRTGIIHNRGKEKLQNIIEKQSAKTENMIEVFRELLILSSESTDIKIVENYRKILTSKGGYGALVNDCEEISTTQDNLIN